MGFAVLLALSVSVAAGASGGPVPSQAQVDAWTRVWQQRLDLAEWHITTRIVRVTDLKPNTAGNIRWQNENKSAVIKVLDPLDYNLPLQEIGSDMEYTIVHELVHLQLSVLPHDASTKMTEEVVVNRISEALLLLEKGRDYKPRTSLASDFVKTGAAEASRVKAQ